MTVWIDPPLWPAHGRLWSHLISDTSLEELHEFADSIGIPARGFEGDHYDLPAELFDSAVAAGARETDGRDLLRRLRESGLRLPKRKGEQGIERLQDVRLADGTQAHIDLIASPREMTHDRVFASMAFVRDGSGAHLLTWSLRRREWGAPGGWREGEESPVATAIRETEEETGLVLRPADLDPVGYERFRQVAGGTGLWRAGRDILQVYAARTPAIQPTVQPELPGHPAPEWVDDAELERRCRAAFWWPLAARILGLARHASVD